MADSQDQNKQAPDSSGIATVSTAKSASALAAGNVTAMVLRLAGGIILAGLLRPKELGTIAGVGLVMVYAAFVQLGVVNALNRELPFHLGAGDRKHAHDLASCTLAWVLMCGILAGTAAFVWAGWNAVLGQGDMGIVWAVHGVALLLIFLNLYLKATFRTSAEFVKLAICQTIVAAIGFILLGVVWKGGFRGQCLRIAAVAVIEIFLLWRWRPVRVIPRFNWRRWWHLVKVGLPIFGVGYFYSVWRHMDRVYVLKQLGKEQLGFYQLAVLTIAAGMSITVAVSQVVYPRMSHAYGKHRDPSMLLTLGWKPTKWLLILAAPMLIGGWFAVEPVVSLILPKYLPGTPAVRWSLVTVYLMCFSPQLAIFIVMKKLIRYAIAIGAGLGVFMLSVPFLREINEDPLVPFSQAMALGTAAFMALCYAMAYYLARPREVSSDQAPKT